MVQCAQDAGFVLKAEQAVGVARNRRRQDFDGDRAIEPGIASAVDFAHAPGTDRRLNFISSKPGARGQRHAWMHYKRNNLRELHLPELELAARRKCCPVALRAEDRSGSGAITIFTM